MFAPDVDNRIATTSGVDTDRDGLPDTVPLPDPVELLLAVDLDGDQLADRIVRIDADGSSTAIPLGGGTWLPTADDSHQCTAPLWEQW